MDILVVGAEQGGYDDGNRYCTLELQPIPPGLQIFNNGEEKCDLGKEFLDNMVPESGSFFGQEQSVLGRIMGEGDGGEGGDGGGSSVAAITTTINLGNSISSLAVPFCGFPQNNKNGKLTV
ncbi:hypothetical protein FRX31_007666 [Thalictrum thalictroides]|uniref:Uncharacterized protein n=1 Tax=Thalictrum thalictroides TaxID=46969 RepID=A0A7J6X117_THATH|nr:hypothetical protein FRX31_007666 [Thalictrum thalictroides]